MLSVKDVEVKRKIINTARAIRKKYLALKLERNENDIAINKALAPLTTPLKKIAENTSLSSRKKRKKIYTESSPSPSSTLNVKSKAESIDTVKEEEKEEKEEEEINKSVSFSNQQQPQPQQSSDDENNYDDAIGFDKSIDERNLQTFLTTYPAPIQPYIYAFLKESSQIDKYYGLKYDSDTDIWTLGSSKVNFLPNGTIAILNQTYKGTPGLYELLFFARPKTYTSMDKTAYKDILQKTSVYRKDYTPTGKILVPTSFKYKNIIKPLIGGGNSSGSGFLSLLEYNEKKKQYKIKTKFKINV
ncbi:hypothetical protein ABEB36_015263 [Hypothenemus hampei]|uniref:DUF8207 domain-containing protein n=1 Tax=Hypothenemus hampei TaxID=57062 RepID=A0ABD1DZP1_HYPHA